MAGKMNPTKFRTTRPAGKSTPHSADRSPGGGMKSGTPGAYGNAMKSGTPKGPGNGGASGMAAPRGGRSVGEL
jgi:hypothetical protein